MYGAWYRQPLKSMLRAYVFVWRGAYGAALWKLVDNPQARTPNMPAPLRNTVDRLDKPSAYYHGKVSFLDFSRVLLYRSLSLRPLHTNPLTAEQNKKRKFDRDGYDERERTPEEQEDPLKDATTLYVGNLWVLWLWSDHEDRIADILSALFTQQKSRYMSFLPSKDHPHP